MRSGAQRIEPVMTNPNRSRLRLIAPAPIAGSAAAAATPSCPVEGTGDPRAVLFIEVHP